MAKQVKKTTTKPKVETVVKEVLKPKVKTELHKLIKDLEVSTDNGVDIKKKGAFIRLTPNGVKNYKKLKYIK